MPRFVIQPTRSVVAVRARSTLHPFTGGGPVSGDIDAELRDGRLDLSRPLAGVLHVDMDALRGEDARLDREMRNRLDINRYPTITAVLHEATETADGRYRMAGELTLHGRTCAVAGEAGVNVDPPTTMRLDGTMRIDIRDFGIDPPRLLMLKVHPEIEVRLDVVAEIDTGG